MATPSSGSPTTRQVALGLFIVWQLFFLMTANLIPYLEDFREALKPHSTIESLVPGWTEGTGHVADACTVATSVNDRWSQLTGQRQYWSLFGPNVWETTPFLALEYRWEKEDWPAKMARQLTPIGAGSPWQQVTTVAATWKAEPAAAHPPLLVLSDNEPPDMRSFFRIGKFRLRRFEFQLLQPHHEAHLRAYLAWKWRAIQEHHPDLAPPEQVFVLERAYSIPPPDKQPTPWTWSGPESAIIAYFQGVHR